MKKLTKSVLLFLLVIVTSVFVTGCSSDEISLMKSTLKSANLNSAVAKTNVSVNIDSDASWVSENAIPASVLEFLNCLQFSTNQKYIQDRSKNTMTVKSEFTVAAEDMSFKSTYWVDVAKDKFVEIFKIPTLAKLALPDEHKKAQYFVLDLNALNQSSFAPDPPMDFAKILSSSYKFQDQYTSFLENYTKVAKIDVNTAKLKSGNVVGSTYTTSLTDKDFKKLLKSAIADFTTNAETRTVVKNFTLALLDYYSSMNEYVISDDWKDQVDAFFTTMDTDPSQYAMIFGVLSAGLDNMTFLGEKGIQITSFVDRNGYVTKTDGVIDIAFDYGAIERIYNPLANVENKLFNMVIKYDSALSEINTLTTVDLPEITPENSIDYVEMVEKSIAEEGNYDDEDYNDYMLEDLTKPAPDGEIRVICNGYKLNFIENKPIMYNDTLYVPLSEFITEYAGFGDTWWDAETGTIRFTIRGVEMHYAPGDSIIKTDGLSYTLTAPTQTFGGVDYVPLRSFVKIYNPNANVEWDDTANAAFITYFYGRR